MQLGSLSVRQLLIALVALSSMMLANTSIAQQQPERLALLIGNKGYSDKVGPLKNPHNDVALIEVALKQLRFRVTVLRDAGYREMSTAIKRHIADVRLAGPGALSFVYYSGHGVANPETHINYLIPVDVLDANDPRIWQLAFEQNDIIDKLSRQAPQATHYVVFDACRNELRLSGEGQKALGAEKGFVPVAQISGLLIAYATAPKQSASDVGDNGGPYAKALAAEIVRPGFEAVTMFRNVQLRVKRSIGQDPWLSFPSLPEVYFAGPMQSSAKPSEVRSWVQPKPSTGPAPLLECDQLAANPDDRRKIGPGTKWSQLNAEQAVSACQRALDAYPSEGRFKYQLARAYQKAASPALALPLLEELTGSGYVAAFDNLAWMYWEGRGAPQDIEKAIGLYARGAEAGSGEAMNNLGMLYWNLKQYDQAEAWFRRSADAGYERGRENFSRAQRRAQSVPHSASSSESARLPPQIEKLGEAFVTKMLERAVERMEKKGSKQPAGSN
jgi:tetratricopeptide (TPR) repeat protein